MLHPRLTRQLGAERRRDLITEAEHARAAAPAHRRLRRALLAAALPAALAAAALPAAAQAGTADLSGSGTLLYNAGFERNEVTMRFVAGKVVITDSAGVRTNTSQCQVFNGALECASPEHVQVHLGGGDDTMQYRLPHSGLVQLGDGNDRVLAGTREFIGTMAGVTYIGDGGFDVVSYEKATSGVAVEMADNLANDGRPGERENVIGASFELLAGSSSRDTLFGTPGPDRISGGLERDIIAGGAGDDVFDSHAKDGADDYHGGPGRDTILYIGRTQPLKVTLDNIANDGETNEADNVRTNVENVTGGSGDDRITSFGTFSRLEGLGGADTLISGAGPDMLIGGAGRDSMEAGGGNDVVDARDGEADFVDCGTEADTVSRDIGEGIIRGCETVNVGVLRLAAKAIDAKAGKPAPVTLSWRHPDGWRKLRTVTLRLIRDGAAVGDVTIRPRGKRIAADGVVKLVRRGTRLTRSGKTVTARLALKINGSMAGQKLALEVEATDNQGRRQLERGAGTIRVAK
jgi:Ca2+-binding RTX toxin-like protein